MSQHEVTVPRPLDSSISGCALCGGALHCVSQAVTGYQEGTSYAIYECDCCLVQSPRFAKSPNWIYDAIYRDTSKIPGYSRYHRYAAMVQSAADPLASLAREESVYSFVMDEVMAAASVNPEIRVLEAGCGLGYLTYALTRRGIKTKGIDISAESVAQAVATFGDRFECCSLESVANSGDRYDVVILTEVIEHVEDPVALLKNVANCLLPSGRALVTTPNRSYFRRNVIWHTDLPPVHLWWFSELGLALGARAAGLVTRLFDFSRYNHFYAGSPRVSERAVVRGTNWVIDRHGGVRKPVKQRALPRQAWRALNLCRRTANRFASGAHGMREAWARPVYELSEGGLSRSPTLAVTLEHVKCPAPSTS